MGGFPLGPRSNMALDIASWPRIVNWQARKVGKTLDATPKAPPMANASSARASLLLLASFAAVYFLWGSTFLAIRVGGESFPPLALAGLRHLSVGLVFYPVFRRASKEKPTSGSGARRLLRASCCFYAAMAR